MKAMTTLEFLSHLRKRDIRLWLDGDRLRFNAPKDAMTPDLRSELTQRKAEVLALLREAGSEGPPFERIPREGKLPLSFSQQRLWFLVEFEPGTPAYNLPEAVRMRGPLDVAALAASLREIARRHEAFRTTFTAEGGRPIQVISRHPRLPLPLVDLGKLPATRREAEARRRCSEAAAASFDLTRGPLTCTLLLRLAEAEQIFLFNIHHIVFDRWSMAVLLRDLGAVYQAFTAGRAPELPEPEFQYVDFAHWQRGWLAGETLESLLAYWRQQLAGPFPMLQLPTDRPRPPVRTANGAKHPVGLPAELSEGLKALGQKHGATAFMTLLAALKALLHRDTGQCDLSVGTFIANRNRSEVEELIGFFVNTLVLRTDLGGNPDFPKLLRKVREVTKGAYAHQDLPFEKLLEELQPEREMSYSPFFQVMLVYQNTPEAVVELPGVTVDRLTIAGGVWANFDLTLWLWEAGATIEGYCDYNTDLFDGTTTARLLGHWRTLLQGLVARPESRLSELPLLSPGECHQLLVGWNDTASEYPRDACIHQLFEAQVERTPGAVAVVGGGRKLTYRELNARANFLAHRLRRLGVGPEVCVAILAERSPEVIIGALGVLKAGGFYLPVDATTTKERLATLLAASAAPVLLTEEGLVPELPEHDCELIALDSPAAASGDESERNPPHRARSANLAYLIYTSGSTGIPKGVMVPHGALVNAYRAWEDAYRLRQTGRCHLQMASFSFDVFAGDLVRALCSGAKLVLCPKEILLAPQKLYELMRDQEVDSAEFVPVVVRELMEYLEKNGQTLDFMRLLVVGSDVWFVREYQQLRALGGAQTRAINSYGLSETTIDSTFFAHDAAALPIDAHVPIGRPFPGTRLTILDRRLETVPIGVFGELLIAGAGLARGYFDQPATTAEQYIPDPRSDEPGARLYKTGDRARYLADGHVEFLGRVDQQIKIRGFRIEPGEIEAVLGEHPDVTDTVVAPWDDAPGGVRLVAWVVAHPERELTVSELRGFLKQRLPDYMVPAVFMMLESLPLLPNGKVDRRRLPEPDRRRPELEGEYTPPESPIEEELAEIFEQVLGIERIGIDDNFFELGGHSLLVVQVVARIQESFELDLPLRTFFEYPTIAELAVRIERELIAKVKELDADEIRALL